MRQQMMIDGLLSQPEVTKKLRPSQRKRCYLIQKKHKEPSDRFDPYWDSLNASEFYFVTATSRVKAVAPTLDFLEEDGLRAKHIGRDGHFSEWTDDWSTVTVMSFSMEEDGFWELLGWSGSTVICQALADWAEKNGRLALQLLKAAQAGTSPGHLAVSGNQGVLRAVEKFQLERSVQRKREGLVSRGAKRI